MPLLREIPLTQSFAGANSLQANGQILAASSNLAGISPQLSIARDPTGVRGMVMKAVLSDSDAITASGFRSELTSAPDSYEEYWYSWKFMLDPSWTNLTQQYTLMQMHDTPDGGDSAKSPNLTVIVREGVIQLQTPGQVLPAEGQTLYGRRFLAAAQVGRWYDVCVHAKWSITAAGFREVFVDGVPMVRDLYTPTAYADAVGPYFKLGVYNTNGSSTFAQRIGYFSDVRIWSGDATYEQGMGRSLAQPPIVAF